MPPQRRPLSCSGSPKSCYGATPEIDADNLTVRCLVMSEFFLATYSVQPDLTVYRILHLDIEQNISQLFAATWRCGSGISDLQLYRDGPWEETFRKIGTEVLSR
jgi:hypothetical protein